MDRSLCKVNRNFLNGKLYKDCFLLEGVAHADELAYMFYTPYMREGIEGATKPLEDPRDRLIMERFVKMWYNFAATG